MQAWICIWRQIAGKDCGEYSKARKDGTISMERLDDAVRRILGVKLASGIFEKGLPSSRVNAGDVSKLALLKIEKLQDRLLENLWCF